MDIDTLTEEVVRRLMEKITHEQLALAAQAPAQDGPEQTGACAEGACKAGADAMTPSPKKQVITQIHAANIAPGSKITYPKGTIITPLARDTFKERGVSVEII